MPESPSIIRKPRPLPSRVILALLPVIAIIAVACTFNAVAWIGQVYPGFFLWQNGFVPAIGAYSSPATDAGLRYQSRLVAVDGAPVGDRDTVAALIALRPPGTEFRYTLEKGGHTYEIRLPSERLSVGVFMLTLGNYLVNALILLALAVAIIFLEPASRSARSFFVFCANYGLYMATSIDLVGPSWFQGLYFFLVTLGPVTALQMVLDFPAVPARLGRLRKALPPLWVASLALGTASVLAFTRSFPLLLALDRVTHLALAGAFVAALAITVIAFRGASLVARQRLTIFFLGLAGASLLPAIVLFAIYTADADAPVPLNYLTLGFAILPAAIAYAIARHDLFGVDAFIRRTVGYIAVTGVIGLLYTVLLVSLHYLLLPDLSASPTVHVLVTMVLVLVFNPLRGRIQAFVDVVFFRAPYDYRRTVAAVSRALASLLDLDEIVARLVRIITEPMQVERAEVWLHDAASGMFRAETSSAPELASDSPLPRHLAMSPGRVLYVDYGSMGGRVSRAALVALRRIDAVLAVPMVFEQRLVGFLALGEKHSGHFYSSEDVELLTTLANQAAVAVQNARAYRALAEANRELREARDQLIETERLAAIGELSAAVAHGIRNPVAGIKSAAELALAEAAPDDPLREGFSDILTEADALESRISELLDFARPFVPNYAPGNLNEVVIGSLHLLRRQITEQSIEVATSLTFGLPGHELDAAQIEQVCLALFVNAIEAMPSSGTLTVTTAVAVGTPSGPAEVVTGGSDPMLELTVRDTGYGIRPEELPKIFRLFYSRKARGTGVGLAIVKRIVESHHGRISAASVAGEGTEFRIVLPLHPGGRPSAPTGIPESSQPEPKRPAARAG